MTIRTVNVDFSLEGDAPDNEVAAFDVREELGRPFTAEVETRFGLDAAVHNAVGKKAILTFYREGNPPRLIAGVVDQVSVRASSDTGDDIAHTVTLRVVSALALLDRNVGCRIFQDMTVKDIVSKILDDNGIATTAQDWRLKGTYPKREYCVQYRESILAFVSRLCEEEGIFFFSDVKDGDELVVFADDSPSAGPIDGDAVLPYYSDAHLNTPEDGVVSLAEHAHIRSGEVVLRDYDFKKPALDLTATVTAKANSELQVYDFPGLYVELADGKRLAQVRLEAEQIDRLTLFAELDCTRVSIGRKLEVAHAIYDTANGEQFVAEAHHSFHKDGGKYITTAKLVPIATKFRTRQMTPRPLIVGPQTARVVGPKDAPVESIHTDEHGRCKVKFHWDQDPEMADKASCWMRVSQLQTSGSMVLPRVDWEVVVEFEEGNPDRPYVMGKLYNGMFMPPYALPEGKTRTSLQTRSTPGGAGSNEIRLEDKAGGEEIMINAQKDHLVKAANNKTKTVSNNESRTIRVNQTTQIGGKQTTKITKGAQTTVEGSQTLSVGTDRTVQVNAVTGVTVKGESKVHVGGNHFEMDGNPLKAILAIAAEKAKEMAKEVAKEQLEKVDEAVKAKVEQVMGPIKKLNDQVKGITDSMEALKNGDLSGAASLVNGVTNLKLPPGFGGGGEKGEGGGGGGSEDGGGEGGGSEDGGEGGGGGGEDGGVEGDGGVAKVGGDETTGVTHDLGIDKAVNSAIDTGIDKGADALGKALGLDGEDGGGSSDANVDGPEGAVEGVDAEDRKKGPGHSLNKVTGNHTESVGTLRVSAALMGVETEIGGDMTETIGGAKANLVWGDITSEVGGDKNESTLGIITVSRADEKEHVVGTRTQMVGGAIAEKIKGNRTIEAKGLSTFVGALHKVEASTALTLKCGSSEMVIDDSGITIKADAVTITAPKIQFTKDVTQASTPGGGSDGDGASGSSASGSAASGASGKTGAAEGGAGAAPPKLDPGKAAPAGKDGTRKVDSPICDPSKHGPPTDDEKKLAAQDHTHPDDGQNQARTDAKVKLVDHHLRTNAMASQETTDEQSALQGGKGVSSRHLTDQELKDANNKIDYTKGIQTYGNGDGDSTGGIVYTNNSTVDPGAGKTGFRNNYGTSDTD